jgi:hypothetical protein
VADPAALNAESLAVEPADAELSDAALDAIARLLVDAATTETG